MSTETTPATPATPRTEPTLASEVLALAQKVRAVRDVYQSRGTYRYMESVMEQEVLDLKLASLQSHATATFENGVIAASLAFGVRGYSPEEDEAKIAESTPIVQIEATYHLKYDIADTTEIRPEVLQAFADINARFNLTAYWREFVSSCASRAGFAPIQIEPFNAAQAIAALKAKPKTDSN